MVLLAATRSGKDHLIRWGILPVIPLERIVVLMTKRGAGQYGDDETWQGWGNLAGPADLAPGFGRGDDGTPRYRIPLVPGRTGPDEVKQLLEQLAAEGEVIVVIGDAGRLTDHKNSGGFGCERHITDMMREGAGIGLSVIACANSSNWAASGIRDQAAAVLIGRSGAAMRDKFSEIAGLEGKSPARRVLDTLRPRWWLYTDHADGELLAGITHPPAAGSADESWPKAFPPLSGVAPGRLAGVG
ncbi:MAG: hypothetical protein ACRDU4_12000 [Mycobacterium sp.]